MSSSRPLRLRMGTPCVLGAAVAGSAPMTPTGSNADATGGAAVTDQQPEAPAVPDGLTRSERDLVMADLGQLLEILGLGNYARPEPPHEVMQQCIAKAARLRNGARMLGQVVTGHGRAMEAARIEMVQGSADKAMEWILNSLPDLWDDPETAWDGKESADEWFTRTESFYRAESAVAGSASDDTTHACTAAPDGPRERTGAVPPLDRESLREIVRNAVANWWTAPVPSEKIADALWPLLEHAQAAAAGSHEGVRLWMADCGELTAKHRERAGYWHKRWTAACERADEDGRQAVSQHVRILELEQRAEAAEAKLAEVRSTVTAFLAHYGNSTAASFQQALDLAHGVLQVLDRAPLEAQERSGEEAAHDGH